MIDYKMKPEVYTGLPTKNRLLYREYVMVDVELDMPPLIEKIVKDVCLALKLYVQDVLSKSRERNLVIARAIITKELRNRTNLSLKSIGRIIGRDHTTVIYMLELYGDLSTTDAQFKKRLRLYDDFKKQKTNPYLK